MRTPSQDLFQLVHSMTSEERRFFRSYCRQYRGPKASNNLRLFALIEALSSYEEQAVKASFDGDLDDNQFAVAKNYLYNTVLRALSDYLGRRGGVQKIQAQLKMVEVLFHKELISQCEKLLKKTLAAAQKYAHPKLVLEVMDWQRRIWNKRQFQGVSTDALAGHREQVQTSLAQSQQLWALQNLHTAFMYNLRTGGFLHNSEESQARFATTINDDLLQAPADAYSFTTRLPYHHTWGIYHMMLGDRAEAMHHLGALVAALDRAPDIAHDHFEFYVTAHYNYATACLQMDRYDEVVRAIGQLDRLKTAFNSQKAKLFACIFLLRVEVYAGTQQVDRALNEALEASAKIGLYREQLTHDERISVSMTIAFILFLHGSYQACHRLIQQEMGADVVAGKADLHVTVEMMRLILYFEMDEEELRAQTSRALSRFFLKHKARYAIESALIRALDRFQTTGDSIQDQQFFKRLYAQHKQMCSDPKESRPVEYFNFGLWLASRASGTPMPEVLRSMAP
jgi:hypothetical protein